ncbi:DMT family transporter [Actinomadura hibisca]|uniref:DMT family transporter n=1 Tax=Actinomadura hibisca TaxID=68565 RepID=UPI000829B8A9|nr:DMT family transporter [Actinomadura hibisca]
MSRRGWVLFALMSVLWGIPYLLIKVAVEDGVSVPMVVFARTALGALLLLPLAVRAGGLAALRGHWRWLLAFAAVEILGPWALLSDAERTLSSGMTGLLIAAVPIVAVVLGRASGDAERLGPARLAGLLLGLVGVGVLAAPHLDGGSAWAIGEVALVVVGYAVGPLIMTRKLREVPSLPMTTACLGVAALIYAVPAAVTRPAELPDGRVLVALAVLGVVCTAVAFVVFFELIREVGAIRAPVFTYVNPAVAVAAGVLLLGEPLDGTILAAFALILGGSVLATARPPAAAGATPAPETAFAAGEVAEETTGDAAGAAEPERLSP